MSPVNIGHHALGSFVINNKFLIIIIIIIIIVQGH